MRENKLNVSQTLTLLYQIVVFNTILDTSQFSKMPYFSFFTKVLLGSVIIAATLLWMFEKGKINKRLIALVIPILGISLVVMVKSDSQISILMVLFLMFIYQDVEPRRFCKKYVEAAIASMVVVFFLCLIGIFPNEYRYRITSSGLVKNRYYLGFIYATVSPNFAFHISLAYLFYKQEDFKFIDALLLLIPNTILYILTDTRAAYFESIFAIVLFWMLKLIKRNWFKKTIGFLSMWLMPFLATIELYIAYAGPSNPLYSMLNAFLSFRFSYVTRALKAYPIGLWGNRITWESGEFVDGSQLVDMFYIRCAIQYGLVFLIIVIIGFMGISAYFKSNGNYFGCIIILILAIHSITDPQLLEYACVPLLIMLLTGYKTIIDNIKHRRKRKNRFLRVV